MALLLVAPSVSAQITTGEPTSKVIKVGNRAEEGDWGIYIGANTSMFKDITDSGIEVSALPLINLKYMYSDEIEARLGLKMYRTTTKEKGELFDSGSDGEFMNRTLNSEYFLTPGLAYHFNRSNLLDVYGGVELPIGFTHDKSVSEMGDDEMTQSSGKFNIGLGAFIGLQAYIANLPVAVGVEYGISSIFNFGDKVKIDNGEDTYYMKKGEKTMYDELSRSNSTVGSEIRVTISYFFK
ncbi:MAG: hypothetical protein KBT20_00390 [Bacteroidales bacterium]|nr:hypothetical protein [Candidatus Liminaster caballi]